VAAGAVGQVNATARPVPSTTAAATFHADLLA